MKQDLVLSLGCPSGVGPEIALKASRVRGLFTVGDVGVLRRISEKLSLDVRIREVESVPARVRKGEIAVLQPTSPLSSLASRPGNPSTEGGKAQRVWIDVACDLVSRGEVGALVTGPVSKEAIVRGGATRFRGHTEYLKARLRSPEVVMAFVSSKLATSLVTTHVPLAHVPRGVRPGPVAASTYHLAVLLHALRGGRPTLAVASLNPHAGEGGLLGEEERTWIVPGIARARSRLLATGLRAMVEGPVPAETAFRKAREGKYDGVVAMYHDQATIAMKLLDFGEAVNVSLGLPIVRTSVDHGTGYDIAGRGKADPNGLLSALQLARRLVLYRRRSA